MFVGAGTYSTAAPRADDAPAAPLAPLDNASLWADVHTDPRFLKWENMPNG
jgi:hypothetical protein